MDEPDGPAAPPAQAPAAERRGHMVAELAVLFLRLGFTAFGGPAAHIAIMRQAVVERRKWLTEGQFLDLLGAANLIPGPSSTELAIFIGFQRARWLGLLLAGVCFILPAALMVSALAWAYGRYGHLPQVAGIRCGVKPVVVAIIVQALWSLGRTAIRTRLLAAVAVAGAVAALLGVNPLAVLLAAGLIVCAGRGIRERPRGSATPLLALVAFIGVLVALPWLLGRYAAPHNLSPPSLFLAFLKLGSVVYGSGYVLLAFLHADLVTGRGWLEPAQLLDAVAVGQVTPGPVFTTATFIGYVLAGPLGALVATVGMFLPAFLLVAVGGPLVPRVRQSVLTGALLDGVNAASLALMLVVAWQLAEDAIRSPLDGLLLSASAFLLLRCRVNPSWLVLGGAVLGLTLLGGRS